MGKKFFTGMISIVLISTLLSCENNREADDADVTGDSVPISSDTSILQNALPDTMYDSSNMDTFP